MLSSSEAELPSTLLTEAVLVALQDSQAPKYGALGGRDDDNEREEGRGAADMIEFSR